MSRLTVDQLHAALADPSIPGDAPVFVYTPTGVTDEAYYECKPAIQSLNTQRVAPSPARSAQEIIQANARGFRASVKK